MIAAIEPLLAYLAATARGLVAGEGDGLERASDLVQQTVLTAVENITRDRGPERGPDMLKAWLRGTMINLHRQTRRARLPQLGLQGDDHGDPTRSPSSRVGHHELVQRMTRARARLGERDRLVLDWKHDEKLSFQGIGRRMGISAQAAHKAHTQALKRLESAYVAVTAEESLRNEKGRLGAIRDASGPGTSS